MYNKLVLDYLSIFIKISNIKNQRYPIVHKYREGRLKKKP